MHIRMRRGRARVLESIRELMPVGPCRCVWATTLDQHPLVDFSIGFAALVSGEHSSQGRCGGRHEACGGGAGQEAGS